jgi:hypothetical protein
MNLDSSLQAARRATVGMSVLGYIALACLVLNAAFWASLMLDLLRPPSLFSPQALQASLAVAAFAVVLPLFWSMLLPSSPAGRLLQRQTWATPGYAAVVFASVFLTWMAGTWLRLWWAAQPTVAEMGQDLYLTIVSLTAGTLVPALCWCVVTPEQWLAQIEQARHVRRIEHAMRMEEAALRAAYARAVSLLNADLTNLTIAQRRELAGILGGFARMQQHALTSIARSWKDMYGVECQLATVPDRELLAGDQKVAGLLADGADAMAESADYAITTVPSSQREQDAEWDDARDASHVPVRVHQGHRPTVSETPHQEAYDKARDVLDGAWRRLDLEQALSISRSQAHRYLADWQDAGMVKGVDHPRDHYTWR